MSNPYTIEQFGGLRLDIDPLEAGPKGAVDLVNVDFDKPGRVRTRDGYSQVKAVTMDAEEGLAVYDTLLSHQFIVGYSTGGTSVYAAYASTGGAAIGTVNPTSTGAISAARTGTSATDYLYLANGVDTIRRWSGSAFSVPADMPIAARLGVTAKSERLVAANIVGTSASRVMFSDAGAPETFGANNYVDLAPGDGIITSIATWQDRMFVFKDRVGFFVFTGESLGASGAPVFNNYSVKGYGAFDSAAGDEGVYFNDGRTIWLTTGSTPSRVSTPVEPFLRGLVSVNGETVDQDASTSWRMSYSLGRLYVSLLTSAAVRRTLVFDPKTGEWTLYGLPVNYVRTLRLGTLRPRSFWLSTAGVEAFDGSTTDNGSAITWSWKSSKYPVSEDARVAVVPYTSLEGSGVVSLALGSDLFPTQSGNATLGVAPAVAEGWPEGVDQEGRWLQLTLSGTGPSSVNRVTHEVQSTKPGGAR